MIPQRTWGRLDIVSIFKIARNNVCCILVDENRQDLPSSSGVLHTSFIEILYKIWKPKPEALLLFKQIPVDIGLPEELSSSFARTAVNPSS